ncbi:MAG: hypothetical protein ACI8W8_004860, partial [Rhodothermales bacterium]
SEGCCELVECAFTCIDVTRILEIIVDDAAEGAAGGVLRVRGAFKNVEPCTFRAAFDEPRGHHDSQVIRQRGGTKSELFPEVLGLDFALFAESAQDLQPRFVGHRSCQAHQNRRQILPSENDSIHENTTQLN